MLSVDSLDRNTIYQFCHPKCLRDQSHKGVVPEMYMHPSGIPVPLWKCSVCGFRYITTIPTFSSFRVHAGICDYEEYIADILLEEKPLYIGEDG